jgi:hypothetical protein
MEHRSASGRRVEPDLAALARDDLLGDIEA